MANWRQAAAVAAIIGVGIVLGVGCTREGATSATPNDTVTAQPASDTQDTLPAPAFDSARAWADLKQQVAFGYRIPGTTVARSTRDWLVKQLTPYAKSVTLQPFSHTLGGKNVQMWNIIADIPGTDPAPRVKVLLAAHWDTRPIADHDPDPAKHKTPIPGANDGASGVAVLLEIARQLKAHPIGHDVTIVLFDGEDYGPDVDNMLLGSDYYAKNLPNPKPDWGILLDMIGDADLDIYREPNSDQLAGQVNDRIFTAARALGFLREGGKPGFLDEQYMYPITDDHIAINKAGVPMADLIDFDYPYWHTTQDTPEHCSAESLRVVGATVLQTIKE